ncbi:response regulator [Nitrospira sp. KM1]|uniref:response regulator n=1 Tax=Nitrospira sp. KM1 TaxID=1936990 RepID=UPI00156507D5|nr:response regulator [Nitrospira sp. KM1]
MEPESLRHILFVDSNREDLEYFALRLRYLRTDYRIDAAKTVREAEYILAKGHIDCVVLELDLSDGSGFELLIRIIPFVRYPKTAVIVLTRLRHRGLSDLALANGAHAYLWKPHTSREQLEQAIRRALHVPGLLREEPGLSSHVHRGGLSHPRDASK